MENSLRKKLKSILKNKRFWFSHKLPVNTGKYFAWPMYYGPHKENLASVQSDSWYNQKFLNLKSKKKFSSKDFGSDVVGWYANGVYSTSGASAPNFKEAASLVSNGFTSGVMLGKLRATELTLSAARNRFNTRIFVDLDKKKSENIANMAEICLSEPVCSVADFSNLLKFEVLARNPALLRHEVRGEDIFAYDKNANFSPSSIANKLYLKQTRVSVDTFKSVISELGKKLGISMYENKRLSGGTVEIYPFKRFAATRQAIRNFKDKLLHRRPEAIGKGLYQLEYPSLGANSATKDAEMVRTEQLYTILKALATKSVEDYLAKTRLMIVDCCVRGKKVDNLPTIEDFDNNKQYLKKASACLIASELSLMALGKADINAANMMRDCFKIEAGQNLSKLYGESKATFMPLIADYYAESVNNFSKDFNVDVAEFAKMKGIELSGEQVENISNALYGKEKIVPSELFGAIPTAEECASLNGITKEAIKQQVIKKIKEPSIEGDKLNAILYGGETIDDMVKNAAKNVNETPSTPQVDTIPQDKVADAVSGVAKDKQAELLIESPRNLFLSSLAKSQFKKVDKDGKLVPLLKTDSLRFELINNGLGQTEEKVILNNKVVDSYICAEEDNYENPEFICDDPVGTIYTKHEWEADENWGTPEAKLYVSKQSLPQSKHGFSLYKDEEHWIYKFDGADLRNDFAKTPEPDVKYLVNGKECDKNAFNQLQDFCLVQANRKDITLAQLSAQDGEYQFKDGVLLTKTASKQSDNSVLFGGVYCTPKQKELVKEYCFFAEVEPIRTSYNKTEPTKKNTDEIKKPDNEFNVISKQSRKWFRFYGDNGLLTQVSNVAGLKFIQTADGLKAFIKNEPQMIHEVPKHMLGKEEGKAGLYAVEGYEIDPVNKSLIVTTDTFRSKASLENEHEEVEYLLTGDKLVYDRNERKLKVNGHDCKLEEYRYLRSMLSVHDNYNAAKNDPNSDQKEANSNESYRGTKLSYASDKIFDFDGIKCSQRERDLYLKYGNNAAIKRKLENSQGAENVSMKVKSKLERKKFLQKLVKGEEPRSRANIRELEKVKNCIPWINKIVASVVDDYVENTLIPRQKKEYASCKKGELDFARYEEHTLERMTQAKLARETAKMLRDPLLVGKNKNQPGIEREKEVWNEWRDWTNGIAYSIIDFYGKNKDMYGNTGITVDVCNDYLQTIGTLSALKKCIAPTVEHIINNKSANKEYAEAKGLNDRNIINPNPDQVIR